MKEVAAMDRDWCLARICGVYALTFSNRCCDRSALTQDARRTGPMTEKMSQSPPDSEPFSPRPYLFFVTGRFFGTLANGSQAIILGWNVYGAARQTMSIEEASFAVGFRPSQLCSLVRQTNWGNLKVESLHVSWVRSSRRRLAAWGRSS